MSAANFFYQASLLHHTFAYLGESPSINGAIVDGLLTRAGFMVVFSKPLLHGVGIERYVTVVGRVSLVLTAAIHPEGMAPFSQPIVRYFRNFLKRTRGGEWLVVTKRLDPTARFGLVVGALIWPVRVPDAYNWFFMPLLGVYVSLALRVIGMRTHHIIRSTGSGHGPPRAHGAPVAADASTSTEVH